MAGPGLGDDRAFRTSVRFDDPIRSQTVTSIACRAMSGWSDVSCSRRLYVATASRRDSKRLSSCGVSDVLAPTYNIGLSLATIEPDSAAGVSDRSPLTFDMK
jgi:hypothetical protein